MKKKTKIILIIAVMILIVLAVIPVAYFMDYYHAQGLGSMEVPQGVTIEEKSGYIVISSENPTGGLIFYPGGKVEAQAYEPLMVELAQRGVECVIVKMPLNFAFFGVDKATTVMDKVKDVEEWYIGGHSLGGVVAAMYVGEHPDAVSGLVLLASYTATDLSATDIRTISIYGTQDGVINKAAYEERRVNNTKDYVEFEIAGGCHGYFGDYGPQEGDGEPTLTRKEQQIQTADLISAWMCQN